ncbi:MAG: translesion error-prone DNA polymerase V autoproteolytic subunit [Alphaproteobacteria bacterium]|nr:translesion error-prone DNA polymerase V autoproteolytic subunit [Alphaproteobacteria bacterium]
MVKMYKSDSIRHWDCSLPTGKGGLSSQEVSSRCLPNLDILQKLRSSINRGNQTYRAQTSRAKSSSFFGSIICTKLKVPYFEHGVSAGYPSPADDPFLRHLDISKYLIKHPKSVYYFKVTGYSMVNAGINHKDLLVVDIALKPKHRDIVIAIVSGEFKLKRLFIEEGKTILLSANPEYGPITITKEMNFFVQGVVTTVIRTFNPLPYDNHFRDVTYPQL